MPLARRPATTDWSGRDRRVGRESLLLICRGVGTLPGAAALIFIKVPSLKLKGGLGRVMWRGYESSGTPQALERGDPSLF